MVAALEQKVPVRLGAFMKPALRRVDVRALARRRVRAGFDSAETTDHNRRHWARADALSADAAASPEVRRTLRNRARYEVANNSYARGIVLTLANDTVGTGPRLQMLADDPGLNRAVETAFHAWAQAVGLAQKLRTMRMARSQDGEAFAVLAFNPFVEHDVQLDLLLVEADQIATPWRHVPDEHEVDGLILDDFGNPIGYRVMKNHPGSTNQSIFDDYTTVPAPAMIHIFRQDRPGQHRGIPEITPALPLFAQLRRFTLAVLSAAEAAVDFDDPAAPPVVVDIPFGFPDMPLKTGAPVGLREISYLYVKLSELAAMGGGATLQLLQTSFLSSQTGFAVPSAGSLTVAGKASGDVTFSGISGDDILSGTPYFEENIGAGYVGFIRVPLKRVEPVDAGSVTKQAVFTTSNGGVSIACTARLSVPKKQRFYAYKFYDSTQTRWGSTYFSNSNSRLYGFSSIVVNATMGFGLALEMMTPNFGTNSPLSLSIGGSFAYNESDYGTDWTPYLDYNGYSLCVIKGTPASSASIYCGKYVTLTIGNHSCTFGIRWSSSTSYSTYSSHQY